MEQTPNDKNAILLNILRTIEENASAARKLIEGALPEDALSAVHASAAVMRSTPSPSFAAGMGGTIVEGVFDGQGMVGPDGKTYPVPPNYASKSKLVEGDMMKLTITPTGAFLFKQIGPIERDRKMGTLVLDRDVDEFSVVVGDKKYRVLKASITYYRGGDQDEAVVLVPKHSPSKWAAVENIIKRHFDTSVLGV